MSRARLWLLVLLARRSLFSSRVTVVLLTLAIAAGAGFQIANMANVAGFVDESLEETLTRGAGDVRVEPREKPRFADGDAMAAALRARPGVRTASPVLVYPGAVGKNGRFYGTAIFGIESEAKPYTVKTGRAFAAGDSDGLLLGTSLARRLDVKAGDQIEVRVIFGPAGTAIAEDNVGRYTMTVRAVVSGTASYRSAFLERGFLADEAGVPKAASLIVVHLDSHADAPAAAAEITASVPDVRALAWRDDEPFLGSWLSANKTITTVSYAMVIAAIALPVWALLYIHVLKRRREIAILAALGFRRLEVFAIYLLQSFVVGLLGCAIGSLIAVALIRYFQAYPMYEQESLVARPLVEAMTFVVPMVIIIATAVIAGSYPAWRAARTEPAAVLRRLE